MKTLALPLLAISSLLLNGLSWGANQNNCSTHWRELDWKLAPFIELNARYFSYPFKIPKGKKLTFKIEGSFPVARYVSFHTYNQETEDPISHLTDFSIEPNPGSVNPFQVGVNRYSPNRQYTVWVHPSSESVTAEQKLIIPFDETRDRFVDIWLRVYANETDTITLPQIFVFDESLNPTNCPEVLKKEWSIATKPGPYGLRIPSQDQQGKVPLPFKNGDVHFFRPSTNSLGANMDNFYLLTRLDGKALFSPLTIRGRRERQLLKKYNAIQNIGDISAFKVQVPSFPNTKAGLKFFSGMEDVRYWSICLSGPDTYTSGCIMDSDVKTKVEPDGKNYAVFIIGPDDSRLKAQIKQLGFNYLDHSDHRIPLVFFRQMLPKTDFEGRIDRVDPLNPEDALNENTIQYFYGENFIHQYSPLGRQCWLEEDFLQSFCGLKIR